MDVVMARRMCITGSILISMQNCWNTLMGTISLKVILVEAVYILKDYCAYHTHNCNINLMKVAFQKHALWYFCKCLFTKTEGEYAMHTCRQICKVEWKADERVSVQWMCVIEIVIVLLLGPRKLINFLWPIEMNAHRRAAIMLENKLSVLCLTAF